jgi:hypothetical protein
VATQVVISIKCRIAKVKADLENPASPVGNAIRTEADNKYRQQGKCLQFRKCEELD